MKLRTKMSR